MAADAGPNAEVPSEAAVIKQPYVNNNPIKPPYADGTLKPPSYGVLPARPPARSNSLLSANDAGKPPPANAAPRRSSSDLRRAGSDGLASSQHSRKRVVEHDRGRYPACIVWSPIQPLTALIPFVGHIGVCSSGGIVYNWVGNVLKGTMAFGAPARYFPLNPDSVEGGAPAWDEQLNMSTRIFDDGPGYNFLVWNCHSFVAHHLGTLSYFGRHGCGRYRFWNTVTLCAIVFFCGRFTSVLAFVKVFGLTIILYPVIFATLGLDAMLFTLKVMCAINGVFVVWFLVTTFLGMSGPHGRCPRHEARIQGREPSRIGRLPSMESARSEA